MKFIEKKLISEFNKFSLKHPPGYFQSMADEVERQYDLKDKRIFEFGCGSGDFLLCFANKGAKKLLGVDISEPSIKDAQSKMDVSHEIEFKCCDILKSNFINSEFDLIISHSVFQYIPDLKSVLLKLNKILAKEGNIYVTIEKKDVSNPINIIQRLGLIFFPEMIKMNFYRLLQGLFAAIGSRQYSEGVLKSKSRYIAIPVLQFPDSHKLSALFESAGFKDIQIDIAKGLDKMSAPHYLITAKK